MQIRLQPLSVDDLPLFRTLLGGPEFGGCFCAVWTSHDATWAARCIDPAEPNFAITTSDVARGRHVGFFAYDGDVLVGWTGAGPKPGFPLLRTKLASRVSGCTPSVWAIGCIAVRAARRGQGVADGIVAAVVATARAAGATSVEAYPTRPADEPRAYRGSLRGYERTGFVEAGAERDGAHEIVLMRCNLVE